MVSSACPLIICLLLVVSTPIFAQSQNAPERITGTNVTGKVTIKGKGVSGIAVGLLAIEDSTHRPTRYTALTDDSGNYRITNVPPGSYRVLAASPAHVPSKQSDSFKSLLISKGETVENIDFDLARGGVITGKVTDSEGRPVIEERVSLEAIEFKESYLYSTPWLIQTDDRGMYRIFGVPPGKYRISAGKQEDLNARGWERSGYKRAFYPSTPDAQQATIIEVTEGSETTNIDITLGRPRASYSAGGRIIDGETGQPLANIQYGVQMFINPQSSSGHMGGAVSNKDGEFKLDNLIPGKYAVMVDAPPGSEWRAESQRFEITDHDVTGLIVKAVKGASISGVIVLEGTQDQAILAKLQMQRLWVHVINEAAASNSSSSSIIDDGTFRVAGLQVGIAGFGFSVQGFEVVRVERDGIVQSGGLEIREREQLKGIRLVVNYGNGSIRGVIKLSTGTPPPNSRFSFWLKRVGEPSGPLTSGSNYSREVDARGQFFAEGLLPGTYEIHAGLYMPGDLNRRMPSTMQEVVVTSGAVTNITLTLQPKPE